ncbi:MAG: Rrf2 family transcriptional regulator [Bdellovibrionales bacterium]|nr:Rrf2 family transcriptional regulator [Bdellovibrionales bacterium]
MLKLHKKVEYGLIALRHMRGKNAELLTTAKEISEIYQLPFDATSRVLQLLSSASWLVSEQGAHGGYRLSDKQLQNLSLFELIEIIEGKQGVVKCVMTNTNCPIKNKCNVVSPMQKLNESLQGFLQQQKVIDLFDSRNTMQGVS